MLIGEFAQRTGLSQDTIRFYIRKGLLAPQSSLKGGRNPYHLFLERDVSTARMIRFAQSLGMPLREIADVLRELQSEGLSKEREIEIMETQIAKLEQKAAELAQLTGYLCAKRDWVKHDRPESEPQFFDDFPCLASVAS
jgi:DNA-binding transcriptional MerR regulator